MTDSAPPEDASPPASAATLAASRLAKLWGQLKRFRGPIAAIAAFGAVLSGFLGYWSVYQTVEKVVAPKLAPAIVTADAGPLSIVVLPFQNLTGDANQEYVVDGLTAGLTADLSRIRDAFIVNAKTAFAYKDKPLTAQQVGRELGVHFVLQGSVQRDGTKIRINAQLADATSNAQLWSENFEGDQSDLFALQDRVTRLVGNSIGPAMIIAAARESETRKSSPRLVDLMLRARALALKPYTLKNLQQQEELYRQALRLEPDNSNAMVGLARSLVFQSADFESQLDSNDKERKYTEARDLALKAKELDPDNAGVYTVIQLYASNHGDPEGALRAATAGLSLAPKSPGAYFNLAVAHFYRGEPNKAIELLTQTIRLDPKHAHPAMLNMGRAYFMLGDNDAAVDWLQKSLEKNSGHPVTYAYLAMAYALKGDEANAHAEAENLRRLDPNFKLLTFEKLDSAAPAAYKEWYEAKLIPASRKAGLPE